MFAALGGRKRVKGQGSTMLFPQELKSGQSSVNEYVAGFQKYSELVELLELSLADITLRIKSGKYYKDFTEEELCRMIRGLFSDSEKRDRVLSLVKK
jgi:hypothetical protein